MELVCGACQGRLLVELPGTTVACPHCGTYLQTAVSAEPGAATILVDPPEDVPRDRDPNAETVPMEFWANSGPLTEPAGTPASIARQADAAKATPTDNERTAPEQTAAGDDSSFEAAGVPAIHLSDAGSVVITPAAISAPSLETTSGPDAGQPAPGSIQLAGAETSNAPETSTGDTAQRSSAVPMEADIEPLESSSFPPIVPPSDTQTGRSGDVREQVEKARTSSLMVKLLASYASAVTLACAYLLYLVFEAPSTLDLPDLAPPRTAGNKVTTLMYLPPEKQIPPANMLRLGESRRFGSLKVTPLRVARGPVEFAFYNPEADQARDPEGPVLKLFLRFENVSKDQRFVPLDRRLVYTKEPDRRAYGLFKTNNFVSPVADRANRLDHVLVFDLSPDDLWLLKDQNLDHEIAPGQIIDTFLATSPEGIGSLKGELVWRVHFRKGYNPHSFRGVTTLIEVLFSSREIIDERPALPASDAPAGKNA